MLSANPLRAWFLAIVDAREEQFVLTGCIASTGGFSRQGE